jgi:hypothetical protein
MAFFTGLVLAVAIVFAGMQVEHGLILIAKAIRDKK